MKRKEQRNKIKNELFGKRLKALREEKGFTQTELAERLGISRTNISNWETGLRIPQVRAVEKLAKTFCVSMDYLYGYSDQRYKIILLDCFELDLTRLNNKGITRLHEYYKLLLTSPEYRNPWLNNKNTEYTVKNA